MGYGFREFLKSQVKVFIEKSFIKERSKMGLYLIVSVLWDWGVGFCTVPGKPSPPVGHFYREHRSGLTIVYVDQSAFQCNLFGIQDVFFYLPRTRNERIDSEPKEEEMARAIIERELKK